MDNVLTTEAPITTTETLLTPDIPVATTAPVTPASWYIDENIPATGDRPEWLPEKYKTVKDAVIGGTNAVKMYSEAFGSPEQYKLENQEIKDNPALELINNIAKENNLSNKLYNQLVNSFVEQEKVLISKQNEMITNLKKEIGDERIAPANNWINSFKVTKDEKDKIIKVLGTSKEAFEVLEIIHKQFTSALANGQPQSQMPYNGIDPTARLKEIYSSPEWRRAPYKFADEVNKLTTMKVTS